MTTIDKIKLEEIECSKENLMDKLWLIENIPWINHSKKMAKLIPNKPISLYVIKNYGSNIMKIKTIHFNNIIISISHGFFENFYSFKFRLNDETVYQSNDHSELSFSKDDAKKIIIEKKEMKIKQLKHQLNLEIESLEKIKKM